MSDFREILQRVYRDLWKFHADLNGDSMGFNVSMSQGVYGDLMKKFNREFILW